MSGAITVMYPLLKTKEKVLAKLTANDLYAVANHGIIYELEDLSQWQGLEGWRLSSKKLSSCAKKDMCDKPSERSSAITRRLL
jgi:hypothetical protein